MAFPSAFERTLIYRIVSRRLLGTWVKYNQNYFYLCPFWELTYRSDTSTDFHARWLKRHGLAQGCAFLGFVHMAPHLEGQIPKIQFWGVNRRFQAKLAKSKNVHIIKTAASIPTKLCTVIKATKCPSWVVLTHASQSKMADGRHLEQSKLAISRPWFERFWWNLTLDRSDR